MKRFSPGGSNGDGSGVSCKDACATAAVGECDANGFYELDSEEKFKLAKPDTMSCDAYGPSTNRFMPCKLVFTASTSCAYGTTYKDNCDALNRVKTTS